MFFPHEARVVDRRNPWFVIAKNLCIWGYRHLVTPHLEIDPALATLKRQQPATVFLYAGLHKSLWETSGLLPALYLTGFPVPLVAMGDNLVNGKFFQDIAKKCSVFLIKRPRDGKNVIESARRFKEDIVHYFRHGIDLLFFPEGTRKNIPDHGRYGDFYPAAFEGALQYERTKRDPAILIPDIGAFPVAVVPVNVDYVRVREAREMVLHKQKRARTLHVLDSISMLKNIGDVYISFGAPLTLADHPTINRKELAALARERCLDLVKILPVNLAANALLRAAARGDLRQTAILTALTEVRTLAAPFAAKFRGFAAEDPVERIWATAMANEPALHTPKAEDLPLYHLYASYTAHYLPLPS